MRVRLVRVPFLVPGWAAAQVLLPRSILVRRGVRLSRRLLAHELRHVDQLAELGLARYWSVYARLLVRRGYHAHPLEVDARRAEADPDYLARAERLLSGGA